MADVRAPGEGLAPREGWRVPGAITGRWDRNAKTPRRGLVGRGFIWMGGGMGLGRRGGVIVSS